MVQKKQQEKDVIKDEQQQARTQRQELKEELVTRFAQRPRLPANRQRIITFSVLGVLAALVALLGVLVLLPASAQQPRGGIAVGMPAPEFRLPIEGGPGQGSISLRDLRGKAVVLNFWSESCPPCNAEVPYLRNLYAGERARSSFVLLGIDQADPREDIHSFGQRFMVNYPLLFDPGSAVNTAYGVTSLPQTYFIDRSGIVRYVVPLQLTPQTMQRGLQAIGVHLT